MPACYTLVSSYPKGMGTVQRGKPPMKGLAEHWYQEVWRPKKGGHCTLRLVLHEIVTLGIKLHIGLQYTKNKKLNSCDTSYSYDTIVCL